MPRKYIRKFGVQSRVQWSTENLQEAARRITAKEIGINEASRYYGIPSRTLRRRIKSGDLAKKALGPEGVLGTENEKRLVKHVQHLTAAGFAPSRKTVRSLAYQFAEKLGRPHKFNKETNLAGWDWLRSFLDRNPELSVRKSHGLSLARAQGLCREEVQHFYDLLQSVLIEHDLINKPANIFNMDESGIQLINKPGNVIAPKGSKNVHVLTSREKDENITCVACHNAEGYFLPPVLIMKGVRQKAEFADGLPPGSKVYMSKKSSYMNAELFMRWMKEHFIPRKGAGKSLLILDGHSSHCNALEMLDLAYANDIIIMCLPSHTTQCLQPLDRSFFCPLKTYYNEEAHKWMLNHSSRNITRFQVGQLIGKAWNKAASVKNGISGFAVTGIFPLDANAIPDHFFTMSNAANQPQASTEQSNNLTAQPNVQAGGSNSTTPITPSKLLSNISPIPTIPAVNRPRKKQMATILTSTKFRESKKAAEANKVQHLQLSNKAVAKRKLIPDPMSSEDSSISTSDSEMSEEESEDPDNCIECLENYYKTKEKADWICCLVCSKWLHETCTVYGHFCNMCGRQKRRKEMERKKQSKK